MPETLDARSIIKELAEAVLECRSGLAHDYGTCAAGCEDGNYIPFRALRVPCPGSVHATNPPPGPLAGAVFCVGQQGRIYPSCQGRGWVPEPDIERACWRLHGMGFEGGTKEAVLRAAQAWVGGQRCGM